jgi:putative signal transducing protein
MSGKQVVIYSAATLPQAHVLRNVLEDQGIRAEVINDAIQLALGDVPMGWSTAPRVVVDQQHAELARRIALEFDESSRASAESQSWPEAKTETEAEFKSRPAWPCCPKCQTPRQAACPFCGTSGDNFPPADTSNAFDEPDVEAGHTDQQQEAGTHQRMSDKPLLLCTICDEPFTPNYYRNCAHCGYDFGNGIESPESVTNPFSPWQMARLLLALVGLVVLFETGLLMLALFPLGIICLWVWAHRYLDKEYGP